MTISLSPTTRGNLTIRVRNLARRIEQINTPQEFSVEGSRQYHFANWVLDWR